MNKNRYLEKIIIEDAILSGKIAFLSGPRQVGKTTLAELIRERISGASQYFTWDDDEFRKLPHLD